MLMSPKYAHLQKIDNRRHISEATDSAFWKRMQHSLLLALKEQGRLSGLQYQYAREQLHLSSDDLAEKTP